MTTRLTIDATELRKLATDLRRLGDEVNDEVRAVLDDVADEALEQYRADVPKGATKRTRDGIDRDRAYVRGMGDVRVVVGNSHFVARFLEEGTSKMAPREALDPAVRSALDGFPRPLTQRLERLARR